MHEPEPLYQTIKRHVATHIKSGAWQPGARIPSETEIAADLGASRMTVNRAIRELTAEGWVTRIQGVGTFVAQPRPQATLLNIRSISEVIDARGGRHSSQIILKRARPCAPDIARALEMTAGATVFHVILLHKDNGQPVQVEERHVNPQAAPGFLDQDFLLATPSDYLLDLLPVTEIEHHIQARRPTAQECGYLQIDEDLPCLELCRRSWSGRQVVTQVRMINPGADYVLGGRFRVSDRAPGIPSTSDFNTSR